MVNYDCIKSNSISMPNLADGFFLDTLLMEQEMEKSQGIRLSSNDFQNIDNEFLLQYVPFFEVRDPKKIRKSIDKYEPIKGPCSMSIDSLEELSEKVSIAYQISYFHYVLGKKHNLKGSFPELCCGRSAKNVVLSLFDAGFPNAAYVISGTDHAYAALPFVFEKENIQGTVIIDPTYDQLQFSNNTRNAVFIKLGKEWEYKDPITQKDLSPSMVCSIDSTKKSLLLDISGYHDRKEFFDKAFANPIKIQSMSNRITYN